LIDLLLFFREETFYFGRIFDLAFMRGVRFFLIVIVFVVNFSCSSDKKDVRKMTSKRTEKVKKAAEVHPGKIVYMQFCLACHMENGEGVPSLYPPLIQTEYVLGDKKRLIETVINGIEGPVEVKGEKFNNIMAKLDYLRDEQIAEVLTYVRSNFGNSADAVTASEVRMVRSSGVK
jgi:mono/diheme cytochrome c family protein